VIVNQILKLGDEDPWVKQLQEELFRIGLYQGKIDSKFGPKLLQAVRSFQLIKGLQVDGVPGPITLSKLFPTQAKEETVARDSESDLAERIVKVSERYLGHREKKENSSPLIDEWLKACGLGPGYAWCMAAVQGWIFEACQELGLPDALTPNSAGVLDTYNRTKCKKVGPRDGKRGDVLIMDYGEGRGHTGIVIGYKDGYYITIEGNSNEQGSREADSVVVQKRKYNDPRIKGFIRVQV